MENILKKILWEAQSKKNILCVFDLDSTLFCAAGRTQRILRKIPSDPQMHTVCLGQEKLFNNIQVSSKDFGLDHILKKAHIKLNFECYKKVFSFWAFQFFSNNFLKYDVLYKGVQSYLSQLASSGAEIMYLTGRNRPFMGDGTYQQLQHHSLPLKTRDHLMMKENVYTEDAFFKKKCLQQLCQKYQRIWFFENEPSVINFVHYFLPQIHIVFMNSTHSGRQKLHKKFYQISMDYNL